MDIKTKTPQSIPNIAPVVQAEVDKELKAIQREFVSTTRTFKIPVEFRTYRIPFGGAVYTTSEIYGYLDEGTRPHIIRPKKAGGMLRFNTRGFSSKTVPNRLNPRAGRPAKPPTAYAQQVNHPGTEARNYSRIIQERSQKRFKRNLEKALKQALR